jgi:hypothetical protein
VTRGRVVNGQGGGGNNNGKGGGKVPQAATLRYMARYIVALGAKFEKFSILNYDEDYSEEEEGTSNGSNSAFT